LESSSRSGDVVARRLFAQTARSSRNSAAKFIFASTSGVHPVSWIDKVEFETAARVIEALESLDRRVGS
jgi:hypothetical protein